MYKYVQYSYVTDSNVTLMQDNNEPQFKEKKERDSHP